ncbi:TMEM175 family protein [Caulobacter henricii]|uniref:DUF1211 domain-containing protein n=1 Tax=Caulobacter henricii TaxID=69395 RepID=A0A0P0P476_9CAUL|nr:TMEM175 family protein [Caulobacter henricii]ALL15150.1 hypothetical protein AQ619_01115 [Caulobacter henricii]
MSGTDPGEAHLHRLVLFSDAVFAIAITLLAIEIHPPEHWNGIPHLLSLMAPKLAAYAVSFAVIGIYWVSHRRIFSRLASANGILDTLNFVVLGLVALLPLATELLWEQVGGQAYPVYVALVGAIGLALAATWGYAAFIGKLAKPVPWPEAVFILARVAVLPGLMCGLSFFSIIYPWGWALMAALVGGFSLLGRWISRLSASPAPDTTT